MKTIYTFRLMLAPVLLAGCLLFSGGQSATAQSRGSSGKSMAYQKSDNADSRANDEKVIKPQKRKKVKQQRTNHGPKKPIFPQIHRKQESLNRANHRDPYMHFRH